MLKVRSCERRLRCPLLGGATDRPRRKKRERQNINSLGLTVPAIKGNAVLWPSVTNLNPQYDEPKTYHEALPVEVGMKFASNVWIHNYDYRTPSGRNCLLTHKNTH